MTWLELLNGEPLPWLLVRDDANPGIRYFALRDLLRRPADDAKVQEAGRAIMTTGPVPAILAAQNPEGGEQGAAGAERHRAIPALRADPTRHRALRVIREKQDARGRWKLENSLNGKMWADIEQKGRPSKWVTCGCCAC